MQKGTMLSLFPSPSHLPPFSFSCPLSLSLALCLALPLLSVSVSVSVAVSVSEFICVSVSVSVYVTVSVSVSVSVSVFISVSVSACASVSVPYSFSLCFSYSFSFSFLAASLYRSCCVEMPRAPDMHPRTTNDPESRTESKGKRNKEGYSSTKWSFLELEDPAWKAADQNLVAHLQHVLLMVSGSKVQCNTVCVRSLSYHSHNKLNIKRQD